MNILYFLIFIDILPRVVLIYLYRNLLFFAVN